MAENVLKMNRWYIERVLSLSDRQIKLFLQLAWAACGSPAKSARAKAAHANDEILMLMAKMISAGIASANNDLPTGEIEIVIDEVHCDE